jgi:hypothetical protein
MNARLNTRQPIIVIEADKSNGKIISAKIIFI